MRCVKAEWNIAFFHRSSQSQEASPETLLSVIFNVIRHRAAVRSRNLASKSPLKDAATLKREQDAAAFAKVLEGTSHLNLFPVEVHTFTRFSELECTYVLAHPSC